VADWSFLTNHARVLLCIAHDPGARLRDIAAILGITERRAHGIITDLTEAGYVVKRKDGRRNRYEIQASLPLPEPGTREPAVGEVLAVLLGTPTALPGRQTPREPAVTVLFIGYANEEALQTSLRERIAVLWSTSRNELWRKGATSGDVLELAEIRVNCEQNSLLYLVRRTTGGACHTVSDSGSARPSCYYRVITADMTLQAGGLRS
jgi:phosphoribosyl-AMP cyclohydrolase